uniref:TetR family transcriptional regulator n=1 Tax=uncultured bacterium 148 TaxID=698380 RepID=E3T6N2_9BACT|nr:TetR family transcriptional regulator [uncultured bacterium 148]
MSPTPSRTSRDAITAAARAILEEDGLDAVSMQAVAHRVGVRPPSLYKHVADRNALIRAVTDAVTADLGAALRPPRAATDARVDLRWIARTYRAFVHANPVGYGLLFARLDPGRAPDPATLAALGEPIVEAIGRLVGPDDALSAARTFVAFAHGFTSLELAGGFRLGGDVDAAYASGIELIMAGLSGRANPPSGSRRRG